MSGAPTDAGVVEAMEAGPVLRCAVCGGPLTPEETAAARRAYEVDPAYPPDPVCGGCNPAPDDGCEWFTRRRLVVFAAVHSVVWTVAVGIVIRMLA